MKKTLHITRAAVIAALYITLTYVAFTFGLAGGAVQVRFSECLTILPFFTFDAVPGLFIGCILSNIITGCNIFDIIFGSLATLIGALGTYFIGRSSIKIKKWIAVLPPIISNTIIVPLVLAFAYGLEDPIPFLMFTVGIGEVIAAGVGGIILLLALNKYKAVLFKD